LKSDELKNSTIEKIRKQLKISNDLKIIRDAGYHAYFEDHSPMKLIEWIT